MSVGTGSLKRTAESVSSSAKDAENSQTEKQAVKTETVRRSTAAKTTDRAAAPKQPRELQLQKRMLWQQMRKRSRHRESHASFRYIFYRRRDYLWQKKVWI